MLKDIPEFKNCKCATALNADQLFSIITKNYTKDDILAYIESEPFLRCMKRNGMTRNKWLYVVCCLYWFPIGAMESDTCNLDERLVDHYGFH